MKLYYFDFIWGRGDPIRMLLEHAKVEYENVTLKVEQFIELKGSGKLEFGQMPMLETADGRHLVQSWALLRYLGRQYGYYPNEPEEAWKIDSTIDSVEDYIMSFIKFHRESDPERK